MTTETKTERKRRLARERSARRRARERKRREVIGERKFKIKIGAGIAADIECITLAGGFEEQDEAVTRAIRHVASIARRSPTAFRKAMNLRSPV
ncbi:hypothetical protein [Pseudomonas segetis]|uniref:Uncharacterized protein n=1 Tax=Pseudomonas segetis TaxID=298908 RepID=A0A239JPB6_9PSED|nr:hypothetical protein [Pseudomonas segetis]SNT07258.1 hypothetical protein SAMN05216255_4424 [Pseudomonas segetis]